MHLFVKQDMMRPEKDKKVLKYSKLANIKARIREFFDASVDHISNPSVG